MPKSSLEKELAITRDWHHIYLVIGSTITTCDISKNNSYFSIIGWIFMYSPSRNHRIRDEFTCLPLCSPSLLHFLLIKNISIIIISIFSRVILLNQLNPPHLAINARQNNRLQCQHCQQRLSKEWAVLEVSNVPS